jgi:hypothetical protein
LQRELETGASGRATPDLQHVGTVLGDEVEIPGHEPDAVRREHRRSSNRYKTPPGKHEHIMPALVEGALDQMSAECWYEATVAMKQPGIALAKYIIEDDFGGTT